MKYFMVLQNVDMLERITTTKVLYSLRLITAKEHSLRNAYNMDPAYESYKKRKYIDYYAA